jgi:hypothetical protein|tara:strand:- start:3376 stop:3786 length:411 start_codon:yes stop_codon:yes gene_type:complete
MKFIYGIVLIVILNGIWIITANADSGSISLALPSVPGNYQSDKFRDGDLDCMNAIGSATNLEFGVTGLIDRNNGVIDTNREIDVGVYARIIIPLGKRVKNRINCNRLFELAIREKMLEVQRLETELKRLQTLQFED